MGTRPVSKAIPRIIVKGPTEFQTESRNNIQIIPEFVAGIACVLQICLELADSSLKRLVFNVRGETPPSHLDIYVEVNFIYHVHLASHG